MSIDLGGNVTTIHLSGPITLYESSEVRETLISALSDGKDLRIGLETSGPWDLAGLQLLISVVTTGHRAGQAVHLHQVPGVCREIASRCGLEKWLAETAESFL
jgi:ABC-type transporter Mla MlaB component